MPSTASRAVRPELEAKATVRRPVTPDDYRARSVLFIPEQARLSHLVNLPEKEDLGAAVDTAMRLVEIHNTELKDVLPKGYQRLEKSILVELLRLFAPLPRKLSGDSFGLIYEDFLSNFATGRGSTGRGILHPALDSSADHRDHRAVPRSGVRPRVRVGRHVRPVRQVR